MTSASQACVPACARTCVCERARARARLFSCMHAHVRLCVFVRASARVIEGRQTIRKIISVCFKKIRNTLHKTHFSLSDIHDALSGQASCSPPLQTLWFSTTRLLTERLFAVTFNWIELTAVSILTPPILVVTVALPYVPT